MQDELSKEENLAVTQGRKEPVLLKCTKYILNYPSKWTMDLRYPEQTFKGLLDSCKKQLTSYKLLHLLQTEKISFSKIKKHMFLSNWRQHPEMV